MDIYTRQEHNLALLPEVRWSEIDHSEYTYLNGMSICAHSKYNYVYTWKTWNFPLPGIYFFIMQTTSTIIHQYYKKN
jgi:hypothetical protein